MRDFFLCSETRVPCAVDRAFSFFSDAFNLERITPKWLQFRVLTPPPISMGKGTLLDYELRVRGLPMRWQSEITVWEPPGEGDSSNGRSARFVDVQRRGPYRRWEHEHLFEEIEGGTRVVDRVTYAVPGGWIVERLLVGPDVRRIFKYRAEALQRILGTC